jgi:hypothetical protein
MKEDKIGGSCSMHGKYKKYIKIWSGNLKGRYYSEDLGIDGKIILEWVLGKWDGKVWTGCIWLRIGISGRFL